MATCKKPADCRAHSCDCIWKSRPTQEDEAAMQKLIDGECAGGAGCLASGKAGWGGKRQGAGRPKEKSSCAGKTVGAYLSNEDVEYLRLWGSGNTDAIKRLIDRARKFWPQGE